MKGNLASIKANVTNQSTRLSRARHMEKNFYSKVSLVKSNTRSVGKVG